MTFRTRFCAFATLTLMASAVPAFAQPVPDDANKALWCSTAFGLVEPQARAQGQAAAADNFKKYAETLLGTGGDSLKKAGFTADQVKTTTAGYADKVSKELQGGSAAEFTVVECTMLVDPTAAATLQQQEQERQQQQQAPAATPAPADGAAAPAPGADAPAPAAPAAN